MLNALITSALSASLLLTPVTGGVPVAGQTGQLAQKYELMAAESIDLDNRYPVESVSKGFKENILIAVNYLNLDGRGGFVLQPNEVFAFQEKGILPQFASDKIVTQDSDFTTRTGYKMVAGLGGNGVCHLASLMNWTSSEAGLEVVSPTFHDFAKIPGIDRIYGTSISTRNSPERQNLYIRNTFDFPVRFQFITEGNLLVLLITAER